MLFLRHVFLLAHFLKHNTKLKSLITLFKFISEFCAKYLKMQGDVTIETDYNKYQQDALWDGLKGYITNAKLKPDQIIDKYKNLWQIEKAFRMLKPI